MLKKVIHHNGDEVKIAVNHTLGLVATTSFAISDEVFNDSGLTQSEWARKTLLSAAAADKSQA